MTNVWNPSSFFAIAAPRITALAAALALCTLPGCYDSPCPEGRYPEVEVDGAVMYVDAEYGADSATGLCTDPVSEIWLAVYIMDKAGTVIAAPGTYLGGTSTTADLTVIGSGTGQTIIEGESAGISVRDADTLDLQDLTVSGADIGVWTSGLARVSLANVELVANRRFGAYASGGEVEYLDVRVADNGPGVVAETSGGVQLAGSAQGRFTDVEFSGNAGVGLWAIGSTLEVIDSVFNDAVFDADGVVGRAIETGTGSEGGGTPGVSLVNTRIEGYAEAGLVAGGGTAELTGVEISGATSCDRGFAGTAIALTAVDAVLEDVEARDACTTGLWSDRSTLTALDLGVTDTTPGADDLGTAVRLVETTAQLRDSRLAGSTGAALFARCSEEVSLFDTTVGGVIPGANDLGGDALVVGDTTLVVDGGELTTVDRCGVRLVGDSSLTSTGVGFDAGFGDVCLCDQEVEPDWESLFVAANTTTPGGTPVVDVDEGGECPEPHPGGCDG